MLKKSVFMIAALSVMSIAPASAGTKWGLCIAQHGCPWSPPANTDRTEWKTCWINYIEEARDRCSFIDQTGKTVYGQLTNPYAVEGPLHSGEGPC